MNATVQTADSRRRNPVFFSSWVRDVRYAKGQDGLTWLVLFIEENGKEAALVYGSRDAEKEHEIPSWLPGLILAGKGGRSVGSAYHSLLKGKKDKDGNPMYTYQRVTDAAKVKELKEMMK